MPSVDFSQETEVSGKRLRTHTEAVSGPRHGRVNFLQLEQKARYIEATFRSFGLQTTIQEVPFRGRRYRNLIATLEGAGEGSRILVGAHYDAFRGTPGADDNASGVAVLLESAQLVRQWRPPATVEFVAFTLEEFQDPFSSILIGSRHFVRMARQAGHEYRAALILESVGYTAREEGSQRIPPLVKVEAPRRGDFLAVVANRFSRPLMEDFCAAARRSSPDLPLVSCQVPLSGYVVPQARLSDHASFWSRGYPALMLTDTAMFRNPNYHRAGDTVATLDFPFMAKVTRAVVGAMHMLAGTPSGTNAEPPC
jgi:Zn-dependent M28 family amino/carboxypeptidase